jgi:hypothetical protein
MFKNLQALRLSKATIFGGRVYYKVLLASNSMPNHEQMKVGAVKDIY